METFLRQRKVGILDGNIENEIASYVEAEGKKPTIVVDLRSFKYQTFEISNTEILLGGRYEILVRKIDDFFGILSYFGAKLVFFADGPMQEIPAVLRKKNVEYSEAIRVLNVIHEGTKLGLIVPNTGNAQASGFLSTLKYIASCHGEVRRTNLNPFNIEIANFASENRVFAIISNDLDLLFFEGSWHLWSNIYLKEMSTEIYKKERVFETLQLSGKQIQVFGTLVGNGILRSERMKDFYRNVQRFVLHGSSHLDAIIQIVKSLIPDSQTLSSINLWILSRTIFPSSEQYTGLALLQNSINSYDHPKCVRVYENELKREAAKSTFNYIILSNIPYLAELYYFDLSKSDFMPFYEIISPIIKRIMGILLYDTKMCPSEGKRSIFCKTSHDEGYKEISEIPEYPNFEVPKILTLLSEPMGVDPKLDAIRYNLICWALSKELNSAVVQELAAGQEFEAETLLDVLTLFYLCELKQITVEEADCILCSCNDLIIDKKLDVDVNHASTINERDARIAFLFPVVRTYVKRVFRAVGIGNKIIDSTLSFDGLCFHHLRKTWDTESADSRKTLVGDDFEKIRKLYSDQFEK